MWKWEELLFFSPNTLLLAFSFSAEIIWSFIKSRSLDLPLRVVTLLLWTITHKHENVPKGNYFGMRTTMLLQINFSLKIYWFHTDFPMLCFVPTFCQGKEDILHLGLERTEGHIQFFSPLVWKDCAMLIEKKWERS